MVLITVDTLRADHLGCFGYRRETSPNIDLLATQGTVFSSAIAQWPKTSPSVVSLMSSTYGSSNGVIKRCGQILPAGTEVLAEQLEEADFQTVGIVTNRFLGSDFGFDRGFSHFTEVWRTEQDGADAASTTDIALEWLDRFARDRQFFLWIHYLDPHAPYRPPAAYRDFFPQDPTDSKTRDLTLAKGRQDIGAVPIHAQLPGYTRLADFIRQYDAEIRYLDTQIGRVLDALQESSMAKTTMVVLTADHGESLGEHNYYFEHGRLPYDSCIRVPLIIKVPWLNRLRGSIVDDPVELLNLAPTILDAFDLPSGSQAQGVSMLPLLTDGTQDLPEHVFAEAGYTEDYQRIVRRGRWKLILVPDEHDQAIMTGNRIELYDIEADPNETRNLASEYPIVVKALTARLETWVASLPRPPTSEEAPVVLDSTTREALRAFGYVEEADTMNGKGAVVRKDGLGI